MQKKRLVPLLAVMLVFAQAITSLFTFPLTASAVDQDLTALKQYSYYSAFRQCTTSLKNQFAGGKEVSDLMKGIGENMYAWATMGYVVGGDGGNNDGAPDCNVLPQMIVSNFGISAEELVKGLGYSLQTDGNWSLPTTCNKEDIDGFGNCTKIKYITPDFKANWDKLVNSKGIPTTEPAGYSWYYLAMAAYTSGCKANSVSDPTDSQKAKATSRTDGYGWVAVVTDTAGTTTQTVYQLQGKSFSDTMHAYPRPNSDSASSDGDATCGELLSALDGVGNDATTRYASYLKEKAAEEKKAAIMDVIDAYCLKTYPNGQPTLQYQYCLSTTYSAQQSCWTQVAEKINNKPTGDYRDRTTAEKVACMKSNGVSGTEAELTELVNNIDAAINTLDPTDPLDPNPTTPTTEASCTGGPLGFFLCPIVDLSQAALDKFGPMIESLLIIKPMTSGSPQAEALQAIWQIIVGISNLLLVIAFLVVIFSQATSIGLSAYGIKKMLPRIIAAAILINLSFFICSISVDIFNVVGGSVKGIINVGMSAVVPSGTVTSWWDIGGGLLAWVLIAVAAEATLGLIGFLVPALLAGVLAMISLWMMVGLRQVLILLLIIVSPLAFAAMILPGTEPLFKKWYKSFFGLLVMYPVIIAIMYGCALISAILLAGIQAI